MVRAVEAEAINAVAYLLTIDGIRLDPVSAIAAAARGYNDILDLLLDAGVLPDADALCSAAGTSNIQVVEQLLRARAPINDLASDGLSALHYAIVNGQTEIVELLLRSGGNPDVTTEDGTTPLMFAVRGGEVAIVKQLLRYGADQLRRDESGETALDQAKESNQQAVVTILESHVSK